MILTLQYESTRAMVNLKVSSSATRKVVSVKKILVAEAEKFASEDEAQRNRIELELASTLVLTRKMLA